jgi:hypothetical protein
VKSLLTALLVILLVGASGAILIHPNQATSDNPTPLAASTQASGAEEGGVIVLEKYSGWKGVESLATPLDSYIKEFTGSAVYFSDMIWPFADSQNPLHDLLARGSGLITVTILSVEKIYRQGPHAFIVYRARVDEVIFKPQNTIKPMPSTVCAKDPQLCSLAQNQSAIVNRAIESVREGSIVEIILPAFIAEDSASKSNLTIRDLASPFPLLEPGYQYLLFIDVRPDGIHVHYDYVWGPWAYIIMDGRVYSLNYVKPPANLSLDPSKLFESSYIHWEPHPYSQLREIALQKLSAYGDSLEDFISEIRG